MIASLIHHPDTFSFPMVDLSIPDPPVPSIGCVFEDETDTVLTLLKNLEDNEANEDRREWPLLGLGVGLGLLGTFLERTIVGGPLR